MHLIDWLVLASTLLFIVGYGSWKTRKSAGIKGYMMGDQDAKWHTVGISVMATQASAITFLSTPGQAFYDGMGFVQFYFGLPIAMIIIAIVFVPIYRQLKIVTAYEYLDKRFNTNTRVYTALLFLTQRGLAAGITIFAPSIILSAIMGWDLQWLNIGIGLLVTLYTLIGGTKAVSITQKQQMAVILIGMVIAFIYIFKFLPQEVTFDSALNLAGINQKMKLIDFEFDLSNRYNFWSGIIGGTFLALSYFGTDQSQVQRYLSAKSIKESQLGLIFNGIFKIPMQFLILLTGVMVFVLFQFENRPLNFNQSLNTKIEKSIYADEYKALEKEFETIHSEKKELSLMFAKNAQNNFESKSVEGLIKINQAKEKEVITQSKAIIKNIGEEPNDKDYVFMYYILNYLPIGLIGLLIAVILSAAMSSTASELNALATTSTMDIHRVLFTKDLTEKQLVWWTKSYTLLWGVIAIFFASIASLFENLIQFVNIIGSIFYGTILGVFLVGFFVKMVKGQAMFIAAIISQLCILTIYFTGIHSQPEGQEVVSYLMLNFIGVALSLGLGVLIQKIIDLNRGLKVSGRD
jgi:Na+/proline symporter